jgi:hypothetical protein
MAKADADTSAYKGAIEFFAMNGYTIEWQPDLQKPKFSRQWSHAPKRLSAPMIVHREIGPTTKMYEELVEVLDVHTEEDCRRIQEAIESARKSARTVGL